MNRIKKKKFTEKKEYVDINKTIKNQVNIDKYIIHIYLNISSYTKNN